LRQQGQLMLFCSARSTRIAALPHSLTAIVAYRRDLKKYTSSSLTLADMKRSGILNAHLAAAIAGIGHGQTILIADAGMPRTNQVPIVDLAVVLGCPSFIYVVTAIVAECSVERYTIAEELSVSGHPVLTQLRSCLIGTPEEVVSHTDLKALSNDALIFVRTGEATPYANVLLRASVVF
jgi:D-ribose pyranase